MTEPSPSPSAAPANVSVEPAAGQAYEVIRPADIIPEFGLVRRYEPLFRAMESRFGSTRHQVILTDDIERTCALVANYILHAQEFEALLPQGFLAGLGASLMMSNEELFGKGNGVPDKKRTEPRHYTEIVRFSSGEERFEALLDSIYETARERYSPERNPFILLTDRQYSGAFVNFFEAASEKILFLGTIKPPSDPAQAHEFYEKFCRSLYLLGEDAWDHSDIFYKVPPVIWVAPFEFTLPYSHFSCLCAEKHHHFNVPFQHWLDRADDYVARPAEINEESLKKFGFGLHWNRLHVIPELRAYHYYVKRTMEEKRCSREVAGAHLGMTSEEIDYLADTEFDYVYHDPANRWYPDKNMRKILGL